MLHTILVMIGKTFKVHSSSSSHGRPQRLTTASEVNVGITENPSRSSFSLSLTATHRLSGWLQLQTCARHRACFWAC